MKPIEPTTQVRYVGRADYWKAKRSLNLGELDFVSGQVRRVPAEMGRRFLKHRDLFEPVEDQPVEDDTAEDDTAERLEAIDRQRLAQEKAERERLEVLAQLDRMDKEGLEKYAQARFMVNLDKRRTLDYLRDEVRGLVDRFGQAGN